MRHLHNSALVGVLRKHDHPVQILSYALDVESAILGEQLVRALQSANLAFRDDRMSISALGNIMAGIGISGTDNRLVQDLIVTFHSFGLAASQAGPPMASGMS